MVKQLKSRLARIGWKRFLFIWLEKYFLSFKFYLVVKKSKEKSCLLNLSHQIFHRLLKKCFRLQHLSLSGHLLGYCKTSDFFWLIFLVSFPPSLSTMRLPHFSSLNTSLGEFSKFPISPLSMQSSSSSTITFFSEKLLF